MQQNHVVDFNVQGIHTNQPMVGEDNNYMNDSYMIVLGILIFKKVFTNG